MFRGVRGLFAKIPPCWVGDGSKSPLYRGLINMSLAGMVFDGMYNHITGGDGHFDPLGGGGGTFGTLWRKGRSKTAI